MRESAKRAFQAYNMTLATVTVLKYLRQVLMAEDDNWLAMVGNLQKARKIWARMARILGRKRTISRVLGMFFKAVVHAVLLFGSETWVTPHRMGKDLGSFQDRVARRITGRKPKQRVDGSWEYLPLETAMEESGFEEM